MATSRGSSRTPTSLRPVTMKDVARAAEVSRASVSLAFNDPQKLAPATCERILQIAQELGYRRNPAASALRTRRTNTLGLLLPQAIDEVIQNPYYSQLIEGIGQACQLEGYTLLLVPPLRGSILKAIPTASVDGFIIAGLKDAQQEIGRALGEHLPAVQIDPIGPSDFDTVEVDEHDSLARLVEYLLSLGHEHLGIAAIEDHFDIDYHSGLGTVAKRLQAIDSTLRAHGSSLQDERVTVVSVPSTYAGGRRAFAQLYPGLAGGKGENTANGRNAGPRPTAIIALSDVIALGVMAAARTAGLSIPRDLSVTGFDDLVFSELSQPRLTTVRQPIVQKGRLAADLLIDQIKSTSGSSHRRHKLPTDLVLGESTGPKRSE